MTSEQFCYWLQGYIEIQRATGQPIVITDREVQVIEDHLNLVMTKETPVRVPQGLKPAPHPYLPTGIQFCSDGIGQSVDLGRSTGGSYTVPDLVLPMTNASC